MSPNEFDRSLMEDLSQLPPAPGEVESYTPWRAAMTKILWGMGLTTFRFEFFYLQYILPLLGAALLYLGYRTLRRENRWFRLCWVLSGVLLAVHMATDILTATPVMGWIIQNPALKWGLTWPPGGDEAASAVRPVAGHPGGLCLGWRGRAQGLAETGPCVLSAVSGHRPVV